MWIRIALVLAGASLGSTAGAAQDDDARPKWTSPGIAADATLELDAAWEPCRRSKYGLFDRWERLRTPAPARERAVYSAPDFAPFLPSEPVEVGATWSVDRDAVLPFLRQFDESARTRLHHGLGSRPGTWACLRATNDEHVEILLRAHAEFMLDGEIRFSPAQFEGRLVLGRTTGELVSFQLRLPSRNTNVDITVPLELPAEGDRPARTVRSADIGWVPRLELTSPVRAVEPWTASVTDERARSLLRGRFYEFAAVEWLPFTQAVERSAALEKPLFVVLLFGSLDDESC